MAAALDLGAHLGEKIEIPLKPLRSSAETKVFEEIPFLPDRPLNADWLLSISFDDMLKDC